MTTRSLQIPGCNLRRGVHWRSPKGGCCPLGPVMGPCWDWVEADQMSPNVLGTEIGPPEGREFYHDAGNFTTCPSGLLSPWEKAGDIRIEATGKAVSWAVMTDVFLLPLGDGGREGLERERLPRWMALITLLLGEVEGGSPFPMSPLPGSPGPQKGP